MALPDTYSELYPGRFLKSDLFKGRKVTLTIKNIDVEELEGEKGREPKVILFFVERPLDLVIPKTNGFCLKRMFGNNPREWIGKRVTFFPSTTKFGRETVDCVRVWGSPDIAADMKITVPQGRKKHLEMVMHKINPGECGFKGGASSTPPSQPSQPDTPTPYDDLFNILDYTRDERAAWMRTNEGKSDEEMRALLNGEIDRRESAR